MSGQGPVDQRLRLQYLAAMEIQTWALRSLEPGSASPDAAGDAAADSALPVVESPRRADVSQLDWESLQSAVSACTSCELHASRTQTVFGVGNRDADWLIIGEAPGKDEDLQGEPFVGRAGQLLNAMLLAVGLKREQVYIANILKCRPPNNRDPKPEEAAACVGYLHQQIALIKPKLILALGRIAAQRLLKTDTPLTRLRHTVHAMPITQIPFIVTYHPAYLLRSPADKRKAWQDLLFVRKNIESIKR